MFQRERQVQPVCSRERDRYSQGVSRERERQVDKVGFSKSLKGRLMIGQVSIIVQKVENNLESQRLSL